jgi:hypothetical protein
MSKTIAATIHEQLCPADPFKSALILTAARDIVYGKDDRSAGRIEPDERGFINLVNGLMFRVNAPGLVKCIIILQPDDLYSVFFWRMFNLNSRQVAEGKVGEIVAGASRVGWEELNQVIVDLYQRIIKSPSYRH